MAIEILLDQFPTDLVAEHSARMPSEGARGMCAGKVPLNVPFVDDREASFGAPPHTGPLLTHVFWSALSMAYIYLGHNMPCSGHLVMDTPVLAPMRTYIHQLCDDSGCLL